MQAPRIRPPTFRHLSNVFEMFTIARLIASVLCLAAMVLLILCSISSPVIQHFTLLHGEGTNGRLSVGIWGYCIAPPNGPFTCTSSKLGYTLCESHSCSGFLVECSEIRIECTGERFLTDDIRVLWLNKTSVDRHPWSRKAEHHDHQGTSDESLRSLPHRCVRFYSDPSQVLGPTN